MKRRRADEVFTSPAHVAMVPSSRDGDDNALDSYATAKTSRRGEATAPIRLL